MTKRLSAVAVSVLGVFFSLAVYAASNEDSGRWLIWENLFQSVLPFFLLIVVLYFVFVRRFRTSLYNSPTIKRQQQYYDRAEQHMERMEQMMERLVTAVEKKDKQ